MNLVVPFFKEAIDVEGIFKKILLKKELAKGNKCVLT